MLTIDFSQKDAGMPRCGFALKEPSFAMVADRNSIAARFDGDLTQTGEFSTPIQLISTVAQTKSDLIDYSQ